MRAFLALFSSLVLGGILSAQIFINEDFSSASGATPPAGWSTQLAVGSDPGLNWQFSNPGNRPILAPLSAPVAIADSDYLGLFTDVVAQMDSPTFDASGPGPIFLEWDQWHSFFPNSVVNVYVSDGVTMTLIYSNSIGTAPNDHQAFDITVAANNSPNAFVRFEYVANFDFWWQVDNVFVYTPQPLLYPGTGEDLILGSSVNFAPLTGGILFDHKDVVPGDFITVHFESPNGDFIGLNISLLATLFDSSGPGVAEVSPLVFPGIYANFLPPPFGTQSILGSGNLAVVGVEALLPPGGVSLSFIWPPALPADSLLLQALVTGNSTANGFFATTAGHVFEE
ncbi:MAG TPA: hypothetical protein ENK43_07995 [Planctomycetes bacterium]|nr:hypothetical protein [Planctomycetota bacterium]